MSVVYMEPICTAQAIYHEARSDSYRGKVNVAKLVYNRARDLHVSTCYIIKMKGQFPGWPKDRLPSKESDSWKEAYNIAVKVRYDKSPIRYMVLKTVYHGYPNEHALDYSRYHVFYNRFHDPIWSGVEDYQP